MLRSTGTGLGMAYVFMSVLAGNLCELSVVVYVI